MTKTSHGIRIKAEPAHVYQAVATADGLKAWFTPDIEGEVAPGKTAVFRHEGRDSFSWKFTELKPDTISRGNASKVRALPSALTSPSG